MLKIRENEIIFFYNELLIMFNLLTSQIKSIRISPAFGDCKISESNSYILASFYEKKNNFNGIYLIQCDFFQNKIIFIIFPNILYSDKITYFKD